MSRASRVTEAEIDRLHADLKALLAMIEKGRVHDAARHAIEFASTGFGSGGGDGPSGSGVSRPTEAAVLALNKGNNRLRGGLCNADRKRFERNPELWGHDTNQFIVEARHVRRTNGDGRR